MHSGLAVHGRGLDQMIQVFRRLPEHFTLDLYLVAGGDGGGYLTKLKTMAGDDPRFTFHTPVAPHELPGVLSQYDVGVYWIPPFHTNARLSFPNKFFDFVQARLALAIGPSEEMQREVERYGMGVVSRSFELDDIVESMKTLTPENVQEFQLATDHAASELSFEHQAGRMRAQLVALLGE
ncbi:hypothetical protein [Leucobacter chinensis]|uniref:hypothetical protein n=1 Tax=Leucobacter chinensis TaxID=2851010 RepID=UPI0020B69FAE|nr:hypothetical protein [Leucobacter chinensis]